MKQTKLREPILYTSLWVVSVIMFTTLPYREMKNELKVVLEILSGELRRKDIGDCLDVEFLNNKECNIFRCDSDEELKKGSIYYIVEFLTKHIIQNFH